MCRQRSALPHVSHGSFATDLDGRKSDEVRYAAEAEANSEGKLLRRIRYAAPVFTNEPVEDRAPFGQALERADLVEAHEPL